MDHDAHMLYCLLMDDNGEELGGLSTWSHAVQFLLQTYASGRELEAAVDTIENMQMASNEKVNDFYRRLAAAGRDLTGA